MGFKTRFSKISTQPLKVYPKELEYFLFNENQKDEYDQININCFHLKHMNLVYHKYADPINSFNNLGKSVSLFNSSRIPKVFQSVRRELDRIDNVPLEEYAKGIIGIFKSTIQFICQNPNINFDKLEELKKESTNDPTKINNNILEILKENKGEKFKTSILQVNEEEIY